MRQWFRSVVLGGVCACAAAGQVKAQTPLDAAAPDASVGAALRNLASRAGVVFAGQVVAIERRGGVVEVVFRVDTPVLGQTGSTYTLREWAGLWPPGQWRYTVGERAMVFLHAGSPAGLSSAVDGGEGVVPVLAGSDGTALLDIRRLSTRVLRRIGDPLPAEETGGITLADAMQVVQGARSGVAREPFRRPIPPSSTAPASRMSRPARVVLGDEGRGTSGAESSPSVQRGPDDTQ
ncbi:MAG TPA: hypothetical protein VM865_04775 [Acidobacteriaceae bacterium]|jgi:hypothetical protein|nr:hypothetical protein [Acidobacteriaceae bacterium]